MILKVKSSKKNRYLKLLTHLNYALGWELRYNDLKIANELFLFHSNLIADIKDPEDRAIFMFSKENRAKIQRSSEVSYYVFNNTLSKLRKLELIVDNKLTPTIANININKPLTLNIILDES